MPDLNDTVPNDEDGSLEDRQNSPQRNRSGRAIYSPENRAQHAVLQRYFHSEQSV